MFQTINHAQIIWNPKSKSSGVLGGHINVRSLLQKLPQIEILLSDSNLDFLGISETWLKESVCTDILRIEGYNAFRKDRPDKSKKGGGVLLYIKNSITATEIELNTPLECVGVEVRLSPEMSFNVINLYRPPDAGQEFFQLFEELIKSVAQKETIVIGDFNVDWNLKPKRKKLNTILNKVGFKQLMDRPTRITNRSQTIIDLIISNQPQRIKKYYSLTTGMCLADHNLIVFNRKLHSRILKRPQKISFIPKEAIGALDYDIARTNWDSLFSLGDVDMIANGLISTLSAITQGHTKTCVIMDRPRRYPWVTEALRQLMKKRDKALKEYLKSKSEANKQSFTQLRNQTVRLSRRARANYFCQQSRAARGNPKHLWRILDDLTGRNSSKEKITLSVDGGLVTEDTEIVNQFSDNFAKIVNEPDFLIPAEDNNAPVSIPNARPSQHSWSIKTSTILQVANIIKRLNASNTKDYYGLQVTLLQRNIQYLARPLCMLVNQSIMECSFPNALKVAYITPIHKTGCKMNVKNYRPVSILPVISKVIEKVVTTQMTEFLETNQLLSPSQYGFRRGYSTESACVHVTELLRDNIDRGGVVGAVFLDLRKAFDTVSHQRLLNKMVNFDFSAKTIKWIQSYLVNRTQCVRINNTNSTFKKYPKGVPQGSTISPILFSLYINDLPDVCPAVHTQMYADDTAIFYHGEEPAEVAAVLSNAMNAICTWLTDNELSLNVEKTVAIFFAKKDIPNPPPITVEGVSLTIAKSVKYLGVHFDSTLKFKAHIQKLTKTINVTLHTFSQIRNSLSAEAATAFYHAMIMSRFKYCITCWSQATSSSLKQLESLYKRAAKILAKKERSYHHCRIYNTQGLLNMENQIKYSNLMLIQKILNEGGPPSLREHIQRVASTAVRNTRASVHGDCKIPFRYSTFGQAALSVRGTAAWNELPNHLKAIPTTKHFSQKLKQHLIENQSCQCL